MGDHSHIMDNVYTGSPNTLVFDYGTQFQDTLGQSVRSTMQRRESGTL